MIGWFEALDAGEVAPERGWLRVFAEERQPCNLHGATPSPLPRNPASRR